MNQERIIFAGEMLKVGSREFRFEHPIDVAVWIGPCVVLLFDPDSVDGRSHFQNLIALDPETGEQVWKAELATSTLGDRYYRMESSDPLVACSVFSFICTLDPTTGRIVHREFVK